MRRLLALAFAISLLIMPSAPNVQAADPKAGMVFVGGSYSFVDSIGYTHVAGLVQNTQPFPIDFVKVSVRYCDAQDALLLEDWSYTIFDSINPNRTSVFDISSTVPGAVARYALSVDWSIADRAANDNFEVDYGTSPRTVKNNNTTVARFVKVVATCVDAIYVGGPAYGQKLRAFGWTYVDSNATADIQPGQSAPFEVAIDDPDPTDYQICSFSAQSSNSAPSLPVTMTATPSVATYGSLIRLSGTAQPGDAVTAEIPTGFSWQKIGVPATAGADGAYSMTVPLTFLGLVRVRTPAGPSVGSLVWPRAWVTLSKSASTIRHGAYVTLTGVVRPYYPGKTVTIERLTSLGWRRIATAKLTSSSAFSVRVRLSSVATYKLRATIPVQVSSFAGTSATVSIRAR